MDNKKVRLDYDLIHKIERNYGNIRDCPEDDKDLQKLRRALGVKVSQAYRAELWREMMKNKV